MPQGNRREVALIEDDEIVRTATTQWLQLADYHVTAFADGNSALETLSPSFQGIIISDIRLPDIDGLQLMPKLLAKFPHIPIILITGHGDIDMAVQALQDGAFDFFEKPFDPDRLLVSVSRAHDALTLQDDSKDRSEYLQQISGLEKIVVGRSQAMNTLREQIVKIAAIDTNVIIYGETGCGKDLVATCLHQFSQRSAGEYVPINCAAIPEQLFESELFGHESGAFTGATKRRIGKLEYSDKGTLFLDEIESMPVNMQVKVLRALQENSVERLGGNQAIPLDLTVVAAAKENLLNHLTFRQDLFYRLNIAQLYLPPLRERQEDILLLFDYYLQKTNSAYRAVSPSDQQILLSYSWPGNVRELKNIAVRYALDDELTVGEILATKPSTATDVHHTQLSLATQVQNFERKVIAEALNRFNGSIIDVMKELDLPRRTLNQKMVKYGINRSDYVKIP
ncbi:sigma-54-dependent transcriptional regulator [Aliivibrio kagoshimensis]|uniref:sigma-54-dependent transcriptional regulator n=1 Tax=Aliivibrio kagoshimensis TaxID=2910230 RepID=UPI003D0FC8D0